MSVLRSSGSREALDQSIAASVSEIGEWAATVDVGAVPDARKRASVAVAVALG